MYINANQILTELNDNKPFKNPLVLKQELIETELAKKEDFLQTQVKAIFEDKEYYSSFRESAISNKDLKVLDLLQEAPVQQQVQQPVQQPVPQVDPNEAKAKALKDQMDSIDRQQKTNTAANPQQTQSLQDKKLSIQAALEKLKIDSQERIANARIELDKNTGLKRTIAGGLSGGLGAGLIPAAIGGAAWLSKRFM